MAEIARVTLACDKEFCERVSLSGGITLGVLPAGCTCLGMETALVRGHMFLVVLTDIGPFICEPGKSKLTKLELLDG